MAFMTRAASLYHFLFYCEKQDLEKSVFDCGAGGSQPPLMLFNQFEYRTAGIDISKQRVIEARDFEKNHNIQLNIRVGNMLTPDFADNSFSFIYSFNTIFHLSKKDTEEAIDRMLRIICSGGLLYVNFLSIDDASCNTGKVLGKNQFLQREFEGDVIHSFYDDNEPDYLFKSHRIIYKEKKIIMRKNSESFLEYIVQKS